MECVVERRVDPRTDQPGSMHDRLDAEILDRADEVGKIPSISANELEVPFAELETEYLASRLGIEKHERLLAFESPLRKGRADQAGAGDQRRHAQCPGSKLSDTTGLGPTLEDFPFGPAERLGFVVIRADERID